MNLHSQTRLFLYIFLIQCDSYSVFSIALCISKASVTSFFKHHPCMQKFHRCFQFQAGIETTQEMRNFKLAFSPVIEINTESRQLLYVLTICSNGWRKKLNMLMANNLFIHFCEASVRSLPNSFLWTQHCDMW